MDTEQVVFYITVLAAIAGVWFRIETAINAARKDAIAHADKTSTVVTDTVRDVLEKQGLMHAQLNMHRDQFLEYKAEAADKFVKRDDLRTMKDEVISGIRDLKVTVSELHGRMDRVLENELISNKERRNT